MRPLPSLLPILALSLLSGCATFSGKFSSSVQADIGYFSDTTVSMLKEVNFGFTRGGAIYTKEFIAWNESEEAKLMESSSNVDKVLRGIVRYSLRLVAITEAGRSEKEQIQQYADYLQEIQGGVQKALNLPADQYESVIREVRKQKDMMGALRTAQPIMNGMGRFMDQTLDDVDAAATNLAKKLDKKIDARYSEVILYQQALDKEKYNVLRALANIYKSIRNDRAAYDALLKSNEIRDKNLIPKGYPTYPQLVAMSKYLMGKFDIMHTIQKEISPDWETYRDTRRELQKLENQIHQEVKQFRLVTMTWVRAHQKMASGKSKPAEWFDINDAAMKGIRSGIDLIL